MNNDTFGEFNGTFYFTNPTDVERKFLWNNKEYTFAAKSTVPLIIMGEPLENIQEIRKRWALKLAYDRFYEGEVLPTGQDYKKLKEMGNGLPPTFTESILQPFVDECLKPLPITKAVVKEGKKDSGANYKASKAVGRNEDLNAVFREEAANAPVLGEMPTTFSA